MCVCVCCACLCGRGCVGFCSTSCLSLIEWTGRSYLEQLLLCGIVLNVTLLLDDGLLVDELSYRLPQAVPRLLPLRPLLPLHPQGACHAGPGTHFHHQQDSGLHCGTAGVYLCVFVCIFLSRTSISWMPSNELGLVLGVDL